MGDNLTIKEGNLTVREPESSKTVFEVKDTSSPELNLQSFHDYQILKALPAVGGEADIYLLERGGRKYILKLYRLGMDPNEEVLRKTKGISEKFPEHMVRIYEYGHDEKTKRWYEVQEYASHGSLREFITGKPGIKLLNKILEEILEALYVFHESNLLHLDLKPSNILIRKTDPLDLIFTDFGVASILDPELSKKLTSIKGTPLYWSPEAFTGVVGKPADYWSLGIIILEYLLGSHPFSGVDTKVIMYTLSTKGLAIPDSISSDYSLLLKGLLTREPAKRWGYSEVRQWINGERDIPVHYEKDSMEGAGGYAKPYPFHGKEYRSLESLATAFIEDEQSWEDGIAHLRRGFISQWLEKNEAFDFSIQVDKIKSETDDDMMLVQFIYTFNKELPFIVHGKAITPQNLRLFVAKMIRKENGKGEESVIRSLLSGKLTDYYLTYTSLRRNKEDELLALLLISIKNALSKRSREDMLANIYGFLDIGLNESVSEKGIKIDSIYAEPIYKVAQYQANHERQVISIRCLKMAISLDPHSFDKAKNDPQFKTIRKEADRILDAIIEPVIIEREKRIEKIRNSLHKSNLTDDKELADKFSKSLNKVERLSRDQSYPACIQANEISKSIMSTLSNLERLGPLYVRKRSILGDIDNKQTLMPDVTTTRLTKLITDYKKLYIYLVTTVLMIVILRNGYGEFAKKMGDLDSITMCITWPASMFLVLFISIFSGKRADAEGGTIMLICWFIPFIIALASYHFCTYYEENIKNKIEDYHNETTQKVTELNEISSEIKRHRDSVITILDTL